MSKQMHYTENSLEECLRLIEAEKIPNVMPIVHMTTMKAVGDIVSHQCLQTTKCKVFQHELLYFFYGGAFFRYLDVSVNRQISRVPIAFMFKPSVLRKAFKYFPYDTGGAYDDYYGRNWSMKMRNFNKFGFHGDSTEKLPAKFVGHIYGDNLSYLRGRINGHAKSLPEPFPELVNFYMADIGEQDMENGKALPDKRRLMLECQFMEPLDLKENLLWFAMPQDEMPRILQILEITDPDRATPWPFDWHEYDNPREIAARIEQAAMDFMRPNYLFSGG